MHHKTLAKNLRRRTRGTGTTPQRGWGMTETLLTIGALSVMSLAIYAVLKPADATAQVRIEQDNLREISRNVDRSFGFLGSFQGLDTARVATEGLAPPRMKRSGSDLRTQWGESVSIQPYEDAARGISAGTAFSITYPGTPAEVCAGLASAMGRDAFDILVNGSSVYDHNGMDPSAASERCADGNATMEFVFHSGLVAGQAVAAPPLILPPAPPSTSLPPSSPPVMDIPDNPGVDDATPGVIPTPVPDTAPPPPAPPPVTPPPPAPAPEPIVITDPPPVPITPPGTICTPPASWVETRQRTVFTCPAGAYGSRQEQGQRTVSYSCPEAWDDPVESLGEWSAWAVSSSNCTACPTLAPEVETQWLTHTGTCPTGYLGTVSHEYEQSRSRTRTHVCPAGTQTLPPITLGSWSSWTNTGNTRNPVNTCEPVCVVPSPSTQTEQETRTGTRTLDCPAGQEGEIQQSRPEARTRSRTASCPAPTGSPTWSSWSAWSSWAGTGSWTTTSNTCTAACTALPGGLGGELLFSDNHGPKYEDSTPTLYRVQWPHGGYGTCGTYGYADTAVAEGTFYWSASINGTSHSGTISCVNVAPEGQQAISCSNTESSVVGGVQLQRDINISVSCDGSSYRVEAEASIRATPNSGSWCP